MEISNDVEMIIMTGSDCFKKFSLRISETDFICISVAFMVYLCMELRNQTI